MAFETLFIKCSFRNGIIFSLTRSTEPCMSRRCAAEPSRTSAPDTSSGMTTIGLVIIGGVFLVVLLLIAVVCVCTSFGSCSENIRSLCTPPLQKHILLMRSNILYANGSDSPAKVSTCSITINRGDEKREIYI
jgi:hypothetical protein